MDRGQRVSALGAAALTLAAAAGCAPSVQLAPVPTVTSTEWRRPMPASAPARSLADAFGSAELAALLDRAAAANTDIGVATARVAQARALLRSARGAMLPVVTASAGASGTRTDRSSGDPFDFSDAFGGLDLAFELDLFGRGRAERRAAGARLRAAEFDREAARLAVQADVARTFVQHAAIAGRIALLDRNIGQALELERIIGVRLRAGAATRVDLGLQTIQVRRLQTERIRLEEALDRTRHALAVLVGDEAPGFAAPAAALDTLSPPAFGAAQPGALVVRRPDIRAAEARIAAAGGDVAAARAAFLPTITLSASALGQAASLSGPIGTTLSAGAGLLAPIFDRGRLNAGLDLAAARQVESVELYRQSLLTALAESENALSAVERSRAREALLLEVVEEARLTARLARLQYLEGEADLQQVLDAEQLLVQAEDARAVALQERLEAAIDLYRAMGGSVA